MSGIGEDEEGQAAAGALLLDRRLDAQTGVLATGSTTWTLPYSVATDGSEGLVQVVVDDVVLTTTRPSATTVRATGDYSADDATIGIRYDFVAILSPLYKRDQQGTAETRGRTQVRSITPAYGATRAFTVEVTPAARTLRSTAFAATAETDGEVRVPVLAENEQVTLTLKNITPFASRITGLDWEGFYHTRSQRV